MEQTSKKFPHPGGLTTNANPSLGSPNGMDFERTAVDQYFADKNAEHWKDEDIATGGTDSPVSSFNPDESIEDSMQRYFRNQQVENSRFMYYPTTKAQK